MYTENEIYSFVKENDIKFIRLSFVDMFGEMKNVSVMPKELPRAFREGVAFDASSVAGFSDEASSDALLIPDAASLHLMPWRPSHGRVVRMFCGIYSADKTPSVYDTRAYLGKAVKDAEKEGITFRFGAECEFYLFRRDENGEPTTIPFDRGSYMDTSPRDRGENIRREICLTLDEMGIEVESSHHESGPGQNEIDFKHGDPAVSADNVVAIKNVIENIALQNGTHASFAPKPLEDESGNGFHINISLKKDGVYDEKTAHHFMAGILSHIAEITAFLNPSDESYRRLGAHKAPRCIAWGRHNRSALIRLPGTQDGIGRMELRSPDCSANPYLAYALLIYAGLDGIKKQLPLPEETKRNLFSDKGADLSVLPASFEEAARMAACSAFVHEVVPKEILSAYRKKAGL